MSTYFTVARNRFGDRVIVDYALHRRPPQGPGHAPDQKMTRVPIYGLAFVDTGRDYRKRQAEEQPRGLALLSRIAQDGGV